MFDSNECASCELYLISSCIHAQYKVEFQITKKISIL